MNILGISNLDYRSHDNAACLLKDGEIVAAAEEERFIRRKHAYDSLPTEAIRFCLKQAGLGLKDVDLVAVGWDILNLQASKGASGHPSVSRVEALRKLLPEEIFGEGGPTRIEFVPHHLAHAASAYYSSGFDSSAVLVIDGEGEEEATTHWHASGKNLQKIHSLRPDPHSLGFMFEGVCDYLGLPNDAAGIVMGLSSFGISEAEAFDLLRLTADGYEMDFPVDLVQSVDEVYSRLEHYFLMEKVRARWVRVCEEIFGSKESIPKGGNPTSDFRRIVAAKVQKTIEEALLHSARVLRERTGESNLCLSGGAALNCSANGALERAGIFDNVYLYPAANDAGVAIGAALYANQRLVDGDPLNTNQFTDNPYLGPSFTDEEILSELRVSGLTYSECNSGGDNAFQRAAELLAKDAVIGWFQGRMEIGPRALGARSILASPNSTEIRDRVNDIKRRERWRPLTPSVLEGYEAAYFTPAIFSPFMLKAAMTRPEARSKIPGVVHVDHTARYHSVRKSTNPAYWALIDSFREITGLPMVLNTSFNDRGEPIVCTPQDAIRTFLNRPMDHLVIGNYLVNRP